MRAIHFEVPRTETSHTAALPQLYADQFGWEEMVRSVARVYASLPPEEQKRAAIFCQNYGEAGAIDFFGSKYGLPPALSGHQNYFYWGPRDYTGEIMIVLDDDATDEREQFGSVEDRGLVENSPWDALGATAAYSCLSRLEDSVAGALAKSAGLVMMRCGNGPHPRLLSEGEGRNAAFSMLRWEQRSPRRCLGEDRRGEFGSLRESLAKIRGV